VLTRIIYEASLPDLVAMSSFVPRVKAIHFIDPGLNYRGIFPSDSDLKSIAILSKYQLRIFIHMTPRQFYDVNRPWIREECCKFYDTGQEAGLYMFLYEYYSGLEPSINMHFCILRDFVTEPIFKDTTHSSRELIFFATAIEEPRTLKRYDRLVWP